VHQPGKARRRDPERQRDRLPEDLPPGAYHGDVTQNRRVKLDVAEGLSGTFEGQLVPGGAVGVVERGLWGAALADAPQIVDGQRSIQPTLGAVQLGLAELDQRRQVSDLRHPSFDRHRLLA
jgi:hypothetical protein